MSFILDPIAVWWVWKWAQRILSHILGRGSWGLSVLSRGLKLLEFEIVASRLTHYSYSDGRGGNAVPHRKKYMRYAEIPAGKLGGAKLTVHWFFHSLMPEFHQLIFHVLEISKNYHWYNSMSNLFCNFELYSNNCLLEWKFVFPLPEYIKWKPNRWIKCA